MSITAKYWKQKNVPTGCHNIPLFRFIGQYGFNFKKKNILDVGCGGGADLIEFKRRGANAYGLDISIPVTNKLKKILGRSKIKQHEIKNKTIPFSVKFDLIYSIDFIYYLTKQEVDSHMRNAHKSLKKNGIFLFGLIEKDLLINKKLKKKYNFEKNYIKKTFKEKNNPINFYDTSFYKKNLKNNGFKIKGTKFFIESYGINEKAVRINKYILCTKN